MESISGGNLSRTYFTAMMKNHWFLNWVCIGH